MDFNLQKEYDLIIEWDVSPAVFVSCGVFCFHFLFGCVFVLKGNVLQWRRWFFFFFYPREQCWPMVLLWRKVKHLLDNLPNVDLNYCRVNAPLLFSQWIKALKTFLSVSLVFSLPLFNFFTVNSGNGNSFGLWHSAGAICWAQPLLSFADELGLVLKYSIWRVQTVLISSFCLSF